MFHPNATATQGPELQLVVLHFFCLPRRSRRPNIMLWTLVWQQETGAGMPGVFLIFRFFNEPSTYTFLDVALNFFNLILRSGIP